MDYNGCKDFLMETAKALLTTDSPSGFTRRAVEVAEGIARELGYAVRRTNKGGLVIEVPGRERGKKVGLCAHIDTLGLMCRSIGPKGELIVTKIGGPSCPPWTGSIVKFIPGMEGYTPVPSSPSPLPATFLTMPPPGPGMRATCMSAWTSW